MSGTSTRRLAIDALERIDTDGAYANLALRAILDRATAPDQVRDRGFVTELVYGTTRRRRACDHLIDRHRKGSVSTRVRAALRVGAYQLAFAGVAPHAAVDATVSASPKRARGLVNAVLRRVADDVAAGVRWPDLSTELSYPDWIVVALRERLGPGPARAALQAMNGAATTHVRPDGYVQDLASRHVVEAVAAGPGSLVLDVCAAPGGKATGLAGLGARVVAADRHEARLRLTGENADATGVRLPLLLADALHLPIAAASFDRVLVDAPCSGLGVLRRRPDARWRVDAAAPARLGAIQRELLGASARCVTGDGLLVYSVCTLTTAENDDVVGGVRLPEGFRLLDTTTIEPDDERDGMFVARWRAPRSV